MPQFKKTDQFDNWLRQLKDRQAQARIFHCLDAAERRHFGDCASVGGGVSEMRIHFGPGYRLYFTRVGETIYLLLIGGDKSTQSRDIKRALEIANDIRRENR
jgi:putative addiction module killer protein